MNCVVFHLLWYVIGMKVKYNIFTNQNNMQMLIYI